MSFIEQCQKMQQEINPNQILIINISTETQYPVQLAPRLFLTALRNLLSCSKFISNFVFVHNNLTIPRFCQDLIMIKHLVEVQKYSIIRIKSEIQEILHHQQDKQNIINKEEIYRQIQQEILCPISLEVFEEPVITMNGHTYEKRNIQKWLRKNNTQPLNNQVLLSKRCAPNRALKKLLENLKKLIQQYENLCLEFRKAKNLEQMYIDSLSTAKKIIDSFVKCSKRYAEKNSQSKAEIDRMIDCQKQLLFEMILSVNPNKKGHKILEQQLLNSIENPQKRLKYTLLAYFSNERNVKNLFNNEIFKNIQIESQKVDKSNIQISIKMKLKRDMKAITGIQICTARILRQNQFVNITPTLKNSQNQSNRIPPNSFQQITSTIVFSNCEDNKRKQLKQSNQPIKKVKINEK